MKSSNEHSNRKKTLVINLFLCVIRKILFEFIRNNLCISLKFSLKITNENMLNTLTKMITEISNEMIMNILDETIIYSIKHLCKHTILACNLTQIALNDNMYIFCDS